MYDGKRRERAKGSGRKRGVERKMGIETKKMGGRGARGGGGAERRGRIISEERRKQKRGNFGKGLKPKPFCREGQNFQVYI